MNSEQFQRVVEAARAAFVATVEFHESLGSTNVRAQQLCQEARLKTPAMIIARRQTEGRGRGTNTWWSGEGSFTFSLIFSLAEERLPVSHLPRVGLATAVALSDACANACADLPSAVAIKWPNDVLLAGRKVAGILVESPRKTNAAPARVVVGIGINVNNRLVGAPLEVRQRGTSLAEFLGQDVEPVAFMASILHHLRRRLQQLASDDPTLANAWTTRCGLRGKYVRVAMGSTDVSGMCLGIGGDGALLIRAPTQGAPTRQIYSGHVADVGLGGKDVR